MVIVLIIRTLRLLNYMFELKDFQIMASTFKNLSAPFASLMLTFYCVMFFYAVVGIYFYNGLITRATMLNTDTDYMYMMMNYNDLWGALCVLI